MAEKFYQWNENGSISIKSGRKQFDVGLPTDVWDLWMPLLGVDVIGVYGTLWRLYLGRTKHIGIRKLKSATRLSQDKLYKIFTVLEDVGAIERIPPTDDEQARGIGTTYVVNGFPPVITRAMIEKYRPKGYGPLTSWFTDMVEPVPKEDPVPNPVQGGTQIGTGGYPDRYTSVFSTDSDTEKRYAGNPQDFHAQPPTAWKDRIGKRNRAAEVSTDRDANEKTKISPADPAFPDIGRLVLSILARNNSDTRNLTAKQIEDLRAAVYVSNRTDVFPSPEEELAAYPIAFKQFAERIEGMPWWKHNKVTAGNVIKALRGYDWVGGWFAYRPGAAGNTPTSTDEMNERAFKEEAARRAFFGLDEEET